MVAGVLAAWPRTSVVFASAERVNYRSAEPARLQTFDLSTEWMDRVSHDFDEPLLPIFADVTLNCSSSGDSAGSWWWTGLEEANHAARLVGSALHLYGFAVPDALKEERQKLGLTLGVTDTIEVLAQTSGWFVRAMLGDTRARRAWVDSAAGEEAGLGRPSIDFDKVFRRFDAHIAALKAGERLPSALTGD